MNPYVSRLRTSLAALAVLLLAVPGAVAAEEYFHSEADLGPFSSLGGNHYVKEGSGQATYLGQFAEVNNFKLKGQNPYGIATLTGANGDALMLAWALAPVGDHYEGVYEIIGGTGRFENATGSGTMLATPNGDGSNHQVFDGTIEF